MKPEAAGLPVGLPCHPAWFILDLLVVPVSLMYAWIGLLALQQLLCLRWLGLLPQTSSIARLTLILK